MASANLPPAIKQRFFDANGSPLSGGFLYFYVAGGSTPAAVYSDRAAGTSLGTSLELDAEGYADDFFLDDSVVYKVELKNSVGVSQFITDNVSTNSVIGKFTTLTVSGNGTLGGTLGVTGATSLTGNLAVNTNKFTVAAASGNTVVAGTVAVTGAQTNSSTLSATQITSTIATGTAPMVVTSTTPVSNLTAVPVTWNHNNADAQLTGAKLVIGSTTLSGGTATVTLTGSAVFASNVSYFVYATDSTAAAAVKVANVSGSQFTITGTTTDVIAWVAIGQ